MYGKSKGKSMKHGTKKGGSIKTSKRKKNFTMNKPSSKRM